jgi:hypothetical protein
MPPSRKLKTDKKRLTRFLKKKPPVGEISLIAIAYRRAVSQYELRGIRTPPDMAIALKRFEAYLGYRVKA